MLFVLPSNTVYLVSNRRIKARVPKWGLNRPAIRRLFLRMHTAAHRRSNKRLCAACTLQQSSISPPTTGFQREFRIMKSERGDGVDMPWSRVNVYFLLLPLLAQQYCCWLCRFVLEPQSNLDRFRMQNNPHDGVGSTNALVVFVVVRRFRSPGGNDSRDRFRDLRAQTHTSWRILTVTWLYNRIRIINVCVRMTGSRTW